MSSSQSHQHDTQVQEKEKEIQDVKQKVDSLKQRITATEKSLMIWKRELKDATSQLEKLNKDVNMEKKEKDRQFRSSEASEVEAGGETRRSGKA